MKRKTIAIILTAALVCTASLPLSFGPGAYALADTGSEEAPAPSAQAEDRVVVLYEDGEIPADAVEACENGGYQEAGTMKAQDAAADEAQSSILDDALGSDYTIEDTIVIGSADEASGRDASESMVVSVISSESSSAGEMAEQLRQSEGVKLAEPDFRYHISSVPSWNDTYIKDCWQLGENGVNADKAPAPSAEAVKDPVVVAVMDTGIDYDHPDLASRMWTEPETGYSLKGRHGVDFSGRDSDPMDENGHGTHCAGIIAAAADNAEGIAGIAGRSAAVQLMAVRILDEEGSGYLSDIVKGFKYIIRAKSEGVNIRAVNCSFGASTTSDIFDAVIDQAGRNGILTIAAAGNEDSNNDTSNSSPANAKTDYTVVVASSDENGGPASYTNYGSKNVDVAAPGSNILSSVSYYNYAPYLYDAATLKKTTQFYSDFSGSSAGVTESFGTPQLYSAHVSGSRGSASVRRTAESGFATLNKSECLRWKISGAKEGDRYALYFPYQKRKGSPAINIVYRTHSDSDSYEGSGFLGIGDVRVTDVDADGNASFSCSSEETEFETVVSKAVNSIWNASGIDGALYDRADIAGLDQDRYGLGFVYEAWEDGDVYIDISSLAVARTDADERAFGKYDVYSGTSMAAPAAAGAAAVLAAADPSMDAEALKAALISATKKDDRLKGICSSCSRIDFSSYNAEAAYMKPAVSSVTADFRAKTVTIRGRGFGSDPSVKAYRKAVDGSGNITEEEIIFDPSDILVDGSSSIAISNAGSSGSGLIGREIRLEISSGGRTGEGTFYVVKGLTPYNDEYRTKLEEEDDFWFWKVPGPGDKKSSKKSDSSEEEFTLMPAGLSFVAGANKLYKYDSYGDIYQIAGGGDMISVMMKGSAMYDALEKYSKKVSKKVDYWIPDYDDEEETLSYGLIGSPAYMGDWIFELIKVDMVDRDAYVLMGLDLQKNKWRVFYDSLAGLGSKPEELSFREIDKATLASYNGRLWLLGCGRNERFEKSQDESSGKYSVTAMDEVFSCCPDTSGTAWRYEGKMPAARTNGRALAQGGKLWYFLSNDSSGTIDYKVYSFDGSTWTAAGELPKALFADTELITKISDFWIETYEGLDTIFCAAGIDKNGLIFSGKSFDGPGDTFRFNTSTGKVEPLKYSLWQTVSDRKVDGTAVGGRFVTEYERSASREVIGKSFPVSSGYVKLKKSVSGKGVVIGGGSYARGEKATITIKPDKGYYIYKISSKGLSPSLNRTYKKATAKSKRKITARFSAAKNGKLTVKFKKIRKK